MLRLFISVALIASLSACVRSATVTTSDGTPNNAFSKQFGTPGSDIVKGAVFAPTSGRTAGGIVVAGETTGSMFENNAGSSDVFVVRYDAAGNILWSRQIGSSGLETVGGVTYSNGNTFVTGTTTGNLFDTNGGASDIYVFKLDSEGRTVWTKQLGTSMGAASAYADTSNAIVADSNGDIFIAGASQGNLGGSNNSVATDDAYIAKFNGVTGVISWQVLFGAAGPTAQTLKSMTIDTSTGDLFVQGETSGADCGESTSTAPDLFALRFNKNGTQLWCTHLGSTTFTTGSLVETGAGIAISKSNNLVYIAGETTGNPSILGDTLGGLTDVFIVSLNLSSGVFASGKQYGGTLIGSAASGADTTKSLTYNSTTDTLYLAGTTTGNLGGANLGGMDFFVIKMNSSMSPISFGQYGSIGTDTLTSLSLDSSGFMLLGGSTSVGWLSGFLGGSNDAIAYKIPSL